MIAFCKLYDGSEDDNNPQDPYKNDIHTSKKQVILVLVLDFWSNLLCHHSKYDFITDISAALEQELCLPSSSH